jgi:excisionase family DNA binding protein
MMSIQRRLYPIDEAAVLLGIGKSNIEGLIRDGVVETVTIGRRRLVPAEAIDDYVERLKAAS